METSCQMGSCSYFLPLFCEISFLKRGNCSLSTAREIAGMFLHVYRWTSINGKLKVHMEELWEQHLFKYLILFKSNISPDHHFTAMGVVFK